MRAWVVGVAMVVVLGWRWLGDKPATREPARLQFAVPIVRVGNLDRAIDYYTDQLGFRLDWKHGDPADFASVSRGRVGVFMCEQCQGNPPAWIMVVTDDVDRLHAELSRRGARIREEPTDREWGTREMLVEDADGNVIRFGSSSGSHHYLPSAAP